MRKTTRLRHLIEDRGILVMPGAYDVLSALLIQEAGFNAVQISGANVAVSHYGVPDYSIVSMGEMVEQAGRIANAVDIPAMGDADTGYGNAVNAYLAVQAFEKAGVAGINIEDQLFPKRCGHLDGKVLIPMDEAVAKITAAVEARTDKDFVINARTDALSVLGIDEVVARGNAFLKAGATMVFVEGVDSVDVIREAVARIDGPVGVNLVEGGKSPQHLSFAELQELGVARVSLPSTGMQATIKALRTVFARLQQDGRIGTMPELLAGFGVSQRLVGRDKIDALEAKFLQQLAASPNS
jgi:2-methylisocitrate lyase-like PEP mutase family enzyme